MMRPLPDALYRALSALGPVRPAGSQWMARCFAGETRYLTRDGVRTLAETVGTSQHVLTSQGTWETAEIRSFGAQPLVEVVLSRNGQRKTIMATAEHRWFRSIDTRDRRKRSLRELTTMDLQPGNRLASAFARPSTTAVFRPSPIAIAHGFIFGDGSVHAGRTRVEVHRAAEDKFKVMPDLIGPMASRVVETESSVRLQGLPGHFKEPPQRGWDRAYLYGWLAGYFAADGNVSRGVPTLYSSRRENLEVVRDLAQALGIGTYGITTQTGTVHLPQGGTKDRTLHRVTFMPSMLTEDFFLLAHHRASFEANQATRVRNDSMRWSVVSVTPTEVVEEVYCAVVPRTANFTLEDNILTGNCPVHSDTTPSLAVKVADSGGVLFFDHAGCATEDILRALGLTFADITPARRERQETSAEVWTPAGPASAVYTYTDEHGTVLYEVLRVPQPGGKKTFRQRRPDPLKPSGWAWNLKGVRPVLYRLPQVIAAVERGEEVIVVEGEKDVHTAESLGRVATCNSGGGGKFRPWMADVFADGAPVLIVADADEPGREHARAVKALLDEVGAVVRVAEPKGGCKDLTEHVEAGFGLDDLQVIDEVAMPDLGLVDIYDLVAGPEASYDWLVEGLLERGERLILTGMEGSGKALSLDTPLPTPQGWTTMGEVEVGDMLLDRDGMPTWVTARTDVEHLPALRVTFSDGAWLLACADHQWLTDRDGVPGVHTTAQIAADLAAGVSHVIGATLPLNLPEREPLTHDAVALAADALSKGRLPRPWLREVVTTRLALLRAMLGEGWLERGTHTVRVHASAAADMLDLLSGLGVVAEREADGEDVLFTFAHTWPMAVPRQTRSVVSVQALGVDVAMRCLSVDSESATYLAGEAMVVTHNTFLMRQFALCVAAGVYPLVDEGERTVRHIEARRVLWVDAENSHRQNKRAFSGMLPLTMRLARDIPDGGFLFAIRPEGLDLAKGDDAAWLSERLALVRPDLLVVGPWYRLFTADPSDEAATRQVIAVLDEARARYGFAVAIEAHSPHSDGFRAPRRGGVRPVRPIGSSILLRWPEFGYGLSFREGDEGPHGLPDFSYADFLAWRGARDERAWPEAFVRGDVERGDFPWMASTVRAQEEAMERVSRSITRPGHVGEVRRGTNG